MAAFPWKRCAAKAISAGSAASRRTNSPTASPITCRTWNGWRLRDFVISALFLKSPAHITALPARLRNRFLSEDSLARHVKERLKIFQQALCACGGCRRVGHQSFCRAKRAPRLANNATSGTDYLKKRSEFLQPRRSGKLDEEVQNFVANLSELAVAASPGGKASAGQPGLMWHGSFLIRRTTARSWTRY